MAVDPGDPDRAFVIPLVSEMDRVTVEGRVGVYETCDRGASWRALTAGLPQKDAYLTILRQSFCADGNNPLGLFFGATSGEVFASIDGGESWLAAARHLPPVLSVGWVAPEHPTRRPAIGVARTPISKSCLLTPQNGYLTPLGR